MATLAAASSDAKSQFEQHYPTIRAMIWRRCWSEECRQNALAWAWYWFTRFIGRSDSPRQAAIAAARFGVHRSRRTFGKAPRHGYVDAMDRTENAPDLDPATCERQNCVELGWSIADMPATLQIVALPLAHGLNKSQTAELVGVSTKTVQRRCDEIAEWIVSR